MVSSNNEGNFVITSQTFSLVQGTLDHSLLNLANPPFGYFFVMLLTMQMQE